ncbi:MAG: phosphate ABC transporter permease PstA [SAR202 cluster bacterium]|nr:phosphate ABC transporter permease PstA [SAR202 cluster bacterium]|tara:strand:+ start:14398 stop:15288 length:891 start_codon:yes stop_codon:yes gene_type:complete
MNKIPIEQSQFNSNLERRKRFGQIIYFLLLSCVLIGIAGLLVLLIRILFDGVDWLSWHFITNFPSRHPELAGMKSAIFGTIWTIALTGVFTVPIGIGAAVYLEEYSPKNWFTQIIEINISNLAGVPSIVYGLLGLALFVQWMSIGRAVLAGALTLALLVLPIVILASREAIKAVPDSYRQASYALGATKWETQKSVVLPSAMPSILTGVILALSRAIGEAAPIIAISALVYLTFIPTNPLSRFTVMPIQIFNWVSRPQDEFRGLAAAGIIILLLILLGMNSIAIYLRNRYQKQSEE